MKKILYFRIIVVILAIIIAVIVLSQNAGKRNEPDITNSPVPSSSLTEYEEFYMCNL